MKSTILISVLIAFASSTSAVESELWKQFVEAKQSGTHTTLPDFSYAGYDYSESPLPETSQWQVFDVTDHGATPNDEHYDDQQIQATIDAAAAAGGGIVFFPPGQFRVSPNTTVGENIFVNASNILLKGSGSGAGGTEILKVNMKVNNGRFMFEIRPDNINPTPPVPLTHIVADASKQSFEIQVADASPFTIGQHIILRADSISFGRAYYEKYGISPAWTELTKGKGFQLKEIHSIVAIEGNTIRFREPLHLNLVTEYKGEKIDIGVCDYPMIENVGVEDIRFKGAWNNFPEEFVHHKNAVHDYAWNALRMDKVTNGWIRNCEFKDWNQGIFINGCSKITATDLLFTGKKGHMSIHTRGSYGTLVKDSVDKAGHWHGPGVGFWGSGAVYLRYQCSPGQYFDSHSGSPYATLMDNVSGANFERNGGPLRFFPHHAKDFVGWNLTIDGTEKKQKFWQTTMEHHLATYLLPIFSGLQGMPLELEEGTYQINESPGQVVEPRSLFEAQLELRLSNALDTAQ